MRELKQNLYDHGGSRIYFDGESGERDLVADTYGDEQRSLAIFHFIQDLYSDEPASPYADANAELEAAQPTVEQIIPKHWRECADWAQKKIAHAAHPAVIQREWQVICEMFAALQPTEGGG